MAQLNSRGTLTRTRWDFFESSNGWIFVDASVPSGPLGLYFTNNSTGATTLDVYSLVAIASAPTAFLVLTIPPNLIASPIAPINTGQSPIQLDRAQLPGVVGAYNALGSNYIRIAYWPTLLSSITLNPLGTMFFTSLPPGYTLSAYSPGVSGALELTMTCWYQEVLDNVPPAR